MGNPIRFRLLFMAAAVAANIIAAQTYYLVSLRGQIEELQEQLTAYRIEVEVPEDSEVELQTDIEANTVRLSGSVNLDSASNGSGLTAAFSARSQFSRSLDLPKPVNGLAMQTAREDDRIVITIPKA